MRVLAKIVIVRVSNDSSDYTSSSSESEDESEKELAEALAAIRELELKELVEQEAHDKESEKRDAILKTNVLNEHSQHHLTLDALGYTDAPPDEYLDPVRLEIMDDPVVLIVSKPVCSNEKSEKDSDTMHFGGGRSYERAVVKHLIASKSLDPYSGESILGYIDNLNLKNIITDWVAEKVAEKAAEKTAEKKDKKSVLQEQGLFAQASEEKKTILDQQHTAEVERKPPPFLEVVPW